MSGPKTTAELRPLARFGIVGLSWALLWLATPGVLGRDGSLALAMFALVPWALGASRPGKRAFLVEWLAAAIGLSAQTYWSTFVLWITLLAVAIVPALYMAVAGVLLRALVKRAPLVLAAPLAWTALETLRAFVEPPFGFGWMRLGHFAHAQPAIAGAARVCGVAGVGFALAAFAAGLASIARARRVGVLDAVLGLGPLLVVAGWASVTRPPMTQDGPRVLLVQPSFAQERKMKGLEPDAMFLEQAQLTKQGLEAARAAGEPTPDLVAWAETMFPYSLGTDDLSAAFDAGITHGPFGEPQYGRGWIDDRAMIEDVLVARELFGRGARQGLLPSGTAFLAGTEIHGPRDGVIRRWNSVLLWTGDGDRAGLASKVHLVPGGEHMMGLERFELIRDVVESLTGGYVPNLAADERTGVFTLPTRSGNRYRFGVSVCFDNSFDDPYTEPLRRGDIDFHLVASNEAWYRESFEYDQMIAFSRLAALQTARSVVRTTNSGISIVIGPDGRDVARLEVGGRDRMVAGALRATVPVPAGEERGRRTFFVRSEPFWIAGWVLAPLAWLLVARIRRGALVTDGA